MFLVNTVVSQCYNTDQAVSNQYGTKDVTVSKVNSANVFCLDYISGNTVAFLWRDN